MAEETDTPMIGMPEDSGVPAPTTPFTSPRKRRYRNSMRDSSMDDSVNELSQLMAQDISPTTKKLIGILKTDFSTLKNLDETSPAYAQKAAELYRSELFLHDILAKDERHNNLKKEHKDLIEKRKILSLGDYHRANFNAIKTEARAQIQNENRLLPHANKKENIIEGKSAKNLLAQLVAEEEAYSQWEMALADYHASGRPSTTPAPTQPSQELTTFLTKVLSKMPGWSLRHAKFEMEEYALRNETAHAMNDEWIELAKQERDPESEHWKTLGALILKDTRIIEQGRGPKHLEHKTDLMLQSLTIYTQYIFASTEIGYDETTGMKEFKSFELTDRYMPKIVQDSSEDNGIEAKIKASDPLDSTGQRIKAEFLEKLSEEKSIQSHWQQKQKDATDAIAAANSARKEAHKSLRVVRKERSSIEADWRRWSKIREPADRD